jgi:hypothetical protein
VAAQSRGQTLEACPPRQGPVWLPPFREPWAGGVELLPCGAAPDAGHAVPLWPPAARTSQQGAAPLLARVTTAEPAPMGLRRRPPGGGIAPASGAAPATTVLRPPASGRPPPSPPPSGPTVPHPARVVAPLAPPTGPGPRAEPQGRGRARPRRPEAAQAREGRPGHPCPHALPAAMCASGGARPGRRDASAPCPTAPSGPWGPRRLGSQPRSGRHPVRIGGRRCGRGPHPPPPVRGDRRHGPPAPPAPSAPVTAAHRRVAPTVSSSAGLPRGRAGPWACGLDQRRPSVGRERCVGHRGPKAALWPCRLAA